MSQDTALAEGPKGRPIEVPASYLTDLPQFFKPYAGEPADGEVAPSSTRDHAITDGPTVEELARAATLGVDPTQTEDEATAESDDEPPVRPDTER
mgnify:CR=1 FL=1